MPDIIDDAFAAVGESADRPARTAAGRPGLPGDVRRRQRAGRAHRARRDGRRDRTVRRTRGRPTGYLRLRDWLTRLYRDRVRRVHRRQLRLAAVAADAAAGPAGRAGRLPALGHGGAPVPHRRAAAAGVHLPGAVRGGSAAERAGGVRRHRLHGHRRRRVLPARRDAGTARCAGRRRGRRRRRIPSTAQRYPSWSGAASRVTRGATPRRVDRIRRRRRGADHRTSRHLSTAGPHTAPAAAAATGAVGRRRPRRVPQRSTTESATTPSCSATPGSRPSATSSTTGA